MEKTSAYPKSGLFCLIGAVAVLAAPVQAQRDPVSLANQHISIIKGLSPRSNAADTRRVLAKNGITLTRTNQWISGMVTGVGHEFKLSGGTTGYFLFSNLVGSKVYSPADPLNSGYINLPASYLRSTALREAYIERLSKHLGKPESRRVSELENGKTIRSAFWKSKNGLSILVDFRYATNTLSLCLGNPEGPSHE